MPPRWQQKKLPAFMQRIVRLSLKGFIFPVTSFILFTIMLAFTLVLYKPSLGPSRSHILPFIYVFGAHSFINRVQRIGWQEWDALYFNAGEDVYRPPKEGAEDDTSTDWWNVDPNTDFDSSSAASLPLDEWLPEQVHDTGSTSFRYLMRTLN